MGTRLLLSGNEAVALAAAHAGVALGSGYPGTPSTEILEHFIAVGGNAQWAPNEKVAAEVGLGVAFANARALVTMKHVGLNVAADVLFTAAYTGVGGGLVLAVADDPGMASSQNEQDTRRYAEAAGVPILEPADAQEAYDWLHLAYMVSERWQIPVIYRLTTRVCHSKGVVTTSAATPPRRAEFTRNIQGRVMLPGNARPAHRRLRAKLAEIQAWNEAEGPQRVIAGQGERQSELGIIAAGVCYLHAREAAPQARLLKLGMTYPPPMRTILDFAKSVDRCLVIEENDPWLATAIRAAGGQVDGKDDDIFRFGELNVERVRRIIAGDNTPEPPEYRGKPPEFCQSCPHRATFAILKKLDCIVAGDIGCYTLAALPPLQAMDTCVNMGAAIGVGLGMRHVLPPEQARRVVSVIGDSTFVHSGITGLVEMVYNPPPTGHVLLILDNGTTAMTGLQEHPGTGRRLDLSPAHRLSYEDLARAVGVPNVQVFNPVRQAAEMEVALQNALASAELTVIVARQPCLLHAAREARRQREQAEHDSPSVAAAPAPTSPSEPPAPLTAPGDPPAAVTNIRFIGLGGMGVVTASDLLADVAFQHGFDVKKAEVHGMSQRGGFVSCDVRFGATVASPMIPAGECDCIVVLAPDQAGAAQGQLKVDGALVTLDDLDLTDLANKKAANVALLGALSRRLLFSTEEWLAALRRRFPASWHQSNEQAFRLGIGGK